MLELWSAKIGKNLDFDELPKTAKNSEKQRGSPLFLASRACPQAGISAENEAALAVNFREKQRKQRRRASANSCRSNAPGRGSGAPTLRRHISW
jgi:hypothetical protein